MRIADISNTATLTEGIMLARKRSRDDLKSSDTSAIVFILQVVQELEFVSADVPACLSSASGVLSPPGLLLQQHL